MDLGRARKILLCLRYGIGDLVMETPVLSTLRKAAPEAWITALGAAPAIELLEGDPRVDEVVGIDRWGLTHRWDEGDTETRRRLDEWLDAEAFDLFLDVHHAAPAIARAVWDRGIRSLEADEAVEAAAVAGGKDGVAAIKVAVRHGWGLDVPDDLLPSLHLQPEDRAFASEFLDAHGLGDGSLPIGLSPVASLPMKRWPEDRLAAVADWVVERVGRTPLLFCGPQSDAVNRVLEAMRHPDRPIVIASVGLRKVAALLERCMLFICNDTGVMHIAAAVGTRVLAVFGPTSPGIYLPPAPNATGLAGATIVCPYRNTDSLHPPGCWTSDHCLIGERSCIWQVDVDRVIATAARAILAASRLMHQERPRNAPCGSAPHYADPDPRPRPRRPPP